MKATEAAKEAAEKGLSPEEVLALIPDYPMLLHKRQWAATFLKNLPENLIEKYKPALKFKGN